MIDQRRPSRLLVSLSPDWDCIGRIGPGSRLSLPSACWRGLRHDHHDDRSKPQAHDVRCAGDRVRQCQIGAVVSAPRRPQVLLAPAAARIRAMRAPGGSVRRRIVVVVAQVEVRGRRLDGRHQRPEAAGLGGPVRLELPFPGHPVGAVRPVHVRPVPAAPAGGRRHPLAALPAGRPPDRHLLAARRTTRL